MEQLIKLVEEWSKDKNLDKVDVRKFLGGLLDDRGNHTIYSRNILLFNYAIPSE